MNFKDLTDDKYRDLSRYLLAYPNEAAWCAQQLNVSESYIKRAMAFYRFFEEKRSEVSTQNNPVPPFIASPEHLPKVPAVPDFPPSPTPPYTFYTEIDADDAIVIADVEIPDHDPVLLKLATAMGMRFGIKLLIIGGDYHAFDSLSDWPLTVATPQDSMLSEELMYGEHILKVARKHFTQVYAILGNHDRRFSRKLGGQLGPYEFMQAGTRPNVSIFAYMYMNTSRGQIYIVHPKKYSRNPLTVPRTLLAAQTQRCHVVSTHTHHCVQGFDASGRWQLVEVGCIRDPKRTKYKMIDDTGHPQWVQGFTMIRRGYITTFPKYATDWRLWLGPDYYHAVFGTQAAPDIALAQAA